jgi:hypothetical protein
MGPDEHHAFEEMKEPTDNTGDHEDHGGSIGGGYTRGDAVPHGFTARHSATVAGPKAVISDQYGSSPDRRTFHEPARSSADPIGISPRGKASPVRVTATPPLRKLE